MQLIGSEVVREVGLEPGEQLPGVRGEAVTSVGEEDQAAAAPSRVGSEDQEVVPEKTGDELGGGLAAVAQAASQLGGSHPGRVEVSEDQGLGRGQCRPALALEPFEEAAVEPAAGPEQQQRERDGGDHPATLSGSQARLSGNLTKGNSVRVLVLGASGGVGRWAVGLAAAAGHEVVAAARTAPAAEAGVTGVAVDVRDAGAVRRTVAGVDAVLWCVGVTKRSGPDVGRVGLAHLVAAAEQAGVVRLVSVSGAGVTLPEDRKGVGARLVSGLTRRLATDLVQDKQGEHGVLAASGLAWTEVRPPRLSEGNASGRWLLSDRAPGLTAKPVTKGDVAAAMLSLAGSGDWLRRSPFLWTR